MPGASDFCLRACKLLRGSTNGLVQTSCESYGVLSNLGRCLCTSAKAAADSNPVTAPSPGPVPARNLEASDMLLKYLEKRAAGSSVPKEEEDALAAALAGQADALHQSLLGTFPAFHRSSCRVMQTNFDARCKQHILNTKPVGGSECGVCLICCFGATASIHRHGLSACR